MALHLHPLPLPHKMGNPLPWSSTGVKRVRTPNLNPIKLCLKQTWPGSFIACRTPRWYPWKLLHVSDHGNGEIGLLRVPLVGLKLSTLCQTYNVNPNWVRPLMAMPGNEWVWAYASNAPTPQQVRRSVWAAERGICQTDLCTKKTSSQSNAWQCIACTHIPCHICAHHCQFCPAILHTRMLCAIPLACDLRSVETLSYLGGLTIWPSVAWNTRDIWWGIFWTQNPPCLNCKSLMKERPHQYIKQVQIFTKLCTVFR